MGRDGRDEAYVMGLCDEALQEPGRRQHTFDWLLGDPGAAGRQARLPVDGYWPAHRLVVEYREQQHERPVPFFDKPDRLTVSGVHRGLQRALYDSRREEAIPAHGLRLVIIRPIDLDADARGRLRRSRDSDLAEIRSLLQPARDEDRVVGAFRAHLMASGWSVVEPVDRWTDVEAVRGAERLIGEAKGRTSAPGTDVDTGYGQLLRRMASSPQTDVRYALIVPTASLTAALRVALPVRRQLRIELYEVSDHNRVHQHDG